MTRAILEEASVERPCGLAEEVIRKFGAIRLRVFGTSMVPSILPGDLIHVRRAGPLEISAGEVVLFIQNGRLFAHRVVGRKVSTLPSGMAGEPVLITRGDRLLQDDAPVSSAELLGRVVSIDRAGRKITVARHKSNRPIARLLQASDRATSIYLRLTAYFWTIFGRRAQCQV